jgi:hypothetical protein
VVGTPFDPNFQLNISKNVDEDEEEVFLYQQAIGSSMHAMLSNRLNVIYVMNTMTKRSQNFKRIHCIVVNLIFNYLKSIMKY